jgi:hypothetical protein
MKRPAICIAFAALLASAIPAHAQETPAAPATAPTTTAPATEAAAPAAADPNECVLPKVPGRLRITMPTKPVTPACVAKRNCGSAVVNKYNAEVDAYNKGMMKVNEAASEYVDELNAFSREINRYSNCEVQRINGIVTE